ncbi:MAG: ankyrin repeat domain-containing protein [Spirochaetaceae bacterium]|nr:ankyrin repeat domain-containing protein [Spirochaetaceae bacterium]
MKQEISYGNITLSQIAHFAISLCGKEALVSRDYLSDAEINDAYKEKCVYEKFRYTDENSIFGKIRQFFTDLENEFDIQKIKSLIKSRLDGKQFIEVSQSYVQSFYSDIIFAYLKNITNVSPFENDINNIAKGTLASIFTDLAICYVSANKLNETLSLDYLFKKIFPEKTLDEKYILISKELSQEDSFEHIKRTIERCRKNNILPPWNIFYGVLKFAYKFDKRFTWILIDKYFYINFKKSLKHISLNIEDWEKIENFFEKYQENNIDTFFEQFVNIKSLNEISINEYYFDNLLKKNTPQSIIQFQNDYNKLKTQLPHSLSFFENWFCGKKYVLEYLDTGMLEKLTEAILWYQKAFREGKYFAGKSLEPFIHEAVCVSVYYDYKKNHTQARNRIQKNSDPLSDTKSSLDKNTKEFYDFGLSFDLFLNEKDDASKLFYFAPENFWKNFPPYGEKAKEISRKDLFRNIEIISKENEFSSDFLGKEDLLELSDSKINNIISSNHDVAYTPISWAIVNNFYDIIELFLDKKRYPSLDINKPSTNNCFPIHEILKKCKGFQTGMVIPIKTINPKVKKLFFKILERSDKKVLFTETNRFKLSPLQTAIETLDIEIVSTIVKKMTGNNHFPSDYRISADEVTPLYYALSYKEKLINFDKFLEKVPIANINYKNLFAPGFLEQDKENILQNEKCRDVAKMMKQELQKAFIEDNKKESESKINKIIDLLIEKTKNVDEFILWSNGDSIEKQQGCTALLFACEQDDIELCKKLISAGADITKAVGKTPMLLSPEGIPLFLPNNFIYQAIQFKSWNCLELALTEYKGKISNLLHCGEIQITPFVYFFLYIQQYFNFKERQYLLERFLPLFLSAGASLEEPTIWGKGSDFLRI